MRHQSGPSRETGTPRRYGCVQTVVVLHGNPWIADAEVTETAFRTQLRAQTRDLSIGGCFVNLHNPSLEGAEVAVTISHGKSTFTAVGTVVAVVPNMGMDVAFKTMEPTQSAVLQEWLAGWADICIEQRMPCYPSGSRLVDLSV